MQRLFFVFMFLALCLPHAVQAKDTPPKTIRITVMAGVVGTEFELMQKAVAMYMADHPGVEIKVVDLPKAANDRLGLYLQFLEAKSTEVDIFSIDVVWPGDMAEHLLDLYQYGARKVAARHLRAAIENDTVDGRLVAMPMQMDAGLLYYRTDLLEKYGLSVPGTWDELEAAAHKIMTGERKQGNSDFWGYVFQGEAYEGLTCNALEWIYSSGGGNIVNQDKIITLDNPQAAAMITRAAGWIGTIAPQGVTAMKEEDSRAVWQSGNAAFMRNWPYAYSLGNAGGSVIKGKFDVAPLPAGSKGSAGTLGGMHLGVNKYTLHPEVAADVALFLTSEKIQKIRAVKGSLYPSIVSLYSDKDVLKASPFIGKLLPVFMNAVARPSTRTAPMYNQVSQVFFKAVYAVMTGQDEAELALEDASFEIKDMLGFQTGLPHY